MGGEYRTVHRGGRGEITEKKSRFIADVRPVHSEEEVQAFLEEVRRTYWDARHHCYAYVYGGGDGPQVQRCSDDGEPGGTAGKPMLEVLLGDGLHDTMVVVTRYFGGVLLGTGGLVRAYQAAARAGLNASTVITRRPGRRWHVRTDYTSLGKIQYLLNQRGISQLDAVYTDAVEFTMILPADEEDQITAELIEGTSGQIHLDPQEPCHFAEADGELLIFEESPGRRP